MIPAAELRNKLPNDELFVYVDGGNGDDNDDNDDDVDDFDKEDAVI